MISKSLILYQLALKGVLTSHSILWFLQTPQRLWTRIQQLPRKYSLRVTVTTPMVIPKEECSVIRKQVNTLFPIFVLNTPKEPFSVWRYGFVLSRRVGWKEGKCTISMQKLRPPCEPRERSLLMGKNGWVDSASSQFPKSLLFGRNSVISIMRGRGVEESNLSD